MQSQSLEDQKKQCHRLAERIEDALNDIFEEAGKALPNRIKRYVFSIQSHTNTLRKILIDDSSTQEDLDQELSLIARRASELEIEIVKSAADEATVSQLNRLLQLVRGSGLPEISTVHSKDGHLSTPTTVAWQKALKEIDTAISKAKNDVSEISSKQVQIRKSQLADAKRAENAAKSLAGLEAKLDESLDAAKAAVNAVVIDLQRKQEEVNNLVGLISGTSVAGSYGKSADAERFWANATRNGSVLLMLVIVLIVGYSLLETGTPHFEWQTSLFRLVFSLALSVPAAYLARESSKHRLQQYTYMRMSLDLQSITPYLASLPEAEQHRLKAEMASRLFGGKESVAPQQESYPLNIQDLMMALISRVGEPHKQTGANKEDKS